MEGLVTYGGWALITALSIWAWARLTHRREARVRKQLKHSVASGRNEPFSLHPVIDPDRCIGCGGCVAACVEREVLGLIDGKAVLIHASRCIGHGLCARACPVEAITLVFGTEKRGVEIPQLTEHFETNIPGLYIVGELGGMGLIHNAIEQGKQAAVHIARSRASREEGIHDLVIVGAGPAGLGASLTAMREGLDFFVVEQEQDIGGTVRHYPRHKIVMTHPVDLPLYGRLNIREAPREAVLRLWEDIVRKTGLPVLLGERVWDIQREGSAFRVVTDTDVHRARSVVLAIGRRGTPRKLGVPGESLPKVAYRLLEPEFYTGSRVLIVGGGDSALEAATSIAEQPDACVALSYRGEVFARAKKVNRMRLAQLEAQGRIAVFYDSNVREIRDSEVVLVRDGTEIRLPNDYVLVCAGGELPVAFLQKIGVTIETKFGRPAIRGHMGREARYIWIAGLYAVGVGVAVALGWMAFPYYLTPLPDRPTSPLHETVMPGGEWGHTLGILGSAMVVLGAALYAVRKRFRCLAGPGGLKVWLEVHIFLCSLGPVLVLYHTALKFRGVAGLSFWSMVTVVLSGLLGRYLYGQIPKEIREGELGLRDLKAESRKLALWMKQRFGANQDAIACIEETASEKERETGGIKTLGAMLWNDLRRPFRLWHLRRFLKHSRNVSGDEIGDIFVLIRRRSFLRRKIHFLKASYGLLRHWHLIHLPLTVVMFLFLAIHLAVTLTLGYFWIF